MLLFLQQKCIIFTNMQIDRGNKMKKQLLSIRNSELFSGISAEEIGILLEEMPVKERTYNKGNFIFYAGDAVRYVHIVLSGVVHIIQEDYWGNRNISSWRYVWRSLCLSSRCSCNSQRYGYGTDKCSLY